MHAPQPKPLTPPSTAALLVRAISALVGFVLLVGLTAAASTPARPAAASSAAGLVWSALPGAQRQLDAEFAPLPMVRAKAGVSAAPSARAVGSGAKGKAATKRVVRHAPVKRWLPSGTGMWLHEWDKSNNGNARGIVNRARANGVSTLYVRSWSKSGGYEAPNVLRRLLPATKNTNVKVVVWEFVYLKHPIAEARRLAAAAKIRVPGAPRVAAVAPDIETQAEGTKLGWYRARAYIRALRAALPKDVAILATVPWPSEIRVGKYPYTALAPYADAIQPMTYWYNRSPVAVTAASVRYLQRFHRPVMPVGQGYDGRLDAPWLPRVNVAGQVGSFLATAKRSNVRAVSLWSWQTAPVAVWQRLAKARHDFKAPVLR